MNSSQSRREFLQFISNQTALLSLSPLALQGLTACTSKDKHMAFTGIKPNFEDKLLLSNGLNYHIVARWGDVINKDGETFGFNNDFTCFLPLANKPDEGLLWVNHESVIPEFVHGKQTSALTRSINEMVKEQESVGGSILHIKKVNKKWTLQKTSQYNRRLHARTKIPFSNGHKIQGTNIAVGTLANCAGGLTPWKTFLTSEENYDNFYGEASIDKNGKRTVKYKKKYQWHKNFPLPPEHYGWVVEINPYTGKAEKQVLLGRAPHEGATVIESINGKAVVYMGEDRPGGYIYKFVSTGLHFKKGTLYAADTVNGRWLPLDINKDKKLKSFFKTQLDVLTYAHQAAEIVGATPQDRPEDIQVHSRTGDVFVALTKNPDKGNKYGSLLKIQEKGGNHESTNFKPSTWVSGGLDSGMACPDNLCFDRKGNLWVTVDMSEFDIGNPDYKDFGHNGLFYIPMSGTNAGVPVQVASAPKDAELTGPWFSPDYNTLFLSVQHPGSSTRKDITKPTSTWPDGPGHLPKPSVVAIEGPVLELLT